MSNSAAWWDEGGRGGIRCLPAAIRGPHDPGMFIFTKRVAVAIRTAFDEGGESPVTVELRPLFPSTLASPKRSGAGSCPDHRRRKSVSDFTFGK